MPRVVLTKRARDGRQRAHHRVRQAVDDAIDQLALGLIEGVPLRGMMKEIFRIRIEDWRILYESRSDGTIRILRIAYRAEAYLSDPR